ncbi:MAG: NERD domain-containing protein [Luteolibacter sp.]
MRQAFCHRSTRRCVEFHPQWAVASSPIYAWSNFEFMALSGAIYEVDLVIVGPWGIFLTEINSRPGEISGSSGSWVWNANGRRWTADNPLPLANRKCKELKSLLQRQQAFSNEAVPFIEPLIFCSHESNTLRLPDEQGHRVISPRVVLGL